MCCFCCSFWFDYSFIEILVTKLARDAADCGCSFRESTTHRFCTYLGWPVSFLVSPQQGLHWPGTNTGSGLFSLASSDCYIYDSATGYYYDPLAGTYYDPNTQQEVFVPQDPGSPEEEEIKEKKPTSQGKSSSKKETSKREDVEQETEVRVYIVFLYVSKKFRGNSYDTCFSFAAECHRALCASGC